MDYVINTSSDSKYFSRVLNLIFSLKFHTPIVRCKIWDLGLTDFQKHILNKLKIEVIKIPPFIDFWDKCYSWKPYVYKYSKEELFFYLDAGCTINKNFIDVYKIIEKDGYFFVNQGQELQDIIPDDYEDILKLDNGNRKSNVFAAGIIGINKKLNINRLIIDKIFDFTIKGYCLGYSISESNRDINNLNIIRNCQTFRHDQSIVNGVFRKHLNFIVIQDANLFASTSLTNNCIFYNQRKISYTYFFKRPNFFKILLFIYCFFIDTHFFLKRYINALLNKIF